MYVPSVVLFAEVLLCTFQDTCEIARELSPYSFQSTEIPLATQLNKVFCCTCVTNEVCVSRVFVIFMS
jgi:hypothetical protein